MNEQALAPIAHDNAVVHNAYRSESTEAFELAQRKAKALAASSMVPTEYRNNLPNVMVAIELAERIGCSIFAVMQNVDIIHGRPSMRAKFLIATVNACGRFTPLRFRWEGEPNTPNYGCRAIAEDRESGEQCVGALISWTMVRAEGWDSKKGSKWKTMPEQMFMYRAAAFWQRIYAPELSLGMHTREEIQDTVGHVAQAGGTSLLAARLGEARSVAGGDDDAIDSVDVSAGDDPAPEHDAETGEVVEYETEVEDA